jgi:hypothetical protein
MAKDDDILADAQEAFQRCDEAETENRAAALDDLKFAKLAEQWPEKIRQDRVRDGRPCLTINRQPAFIRQVVNEARQNRPSIKVHPVDSQADPITAEIYNGLIRNIEQTSKADVAYDTAVDFAVTMGFGYFRVTTDYACDDSFDLDLRIERIANPFSVYGDPFSTSSDSSDWNQAFVTELLPKAAFEAKYKGAEQVSWEDDGYATLKAPWTQDQSILVAEWWQREKVPKTILALSDGTIVEADVYAKQKDAFDAQGITVLGQRVPQSHKVTQKILTGAEVLEENDWAGKYIPIVPVYGDEINVEGKRYFRSLIRDAKDPQRMLNYWRTASTELTALAPRVPFIGKKGTFKSDARKWATINSANHPYVEYDGDSEPKRQPMNSGRAIGSIQEALNAQDDMKSILGLYDPSLGAEGQEVSGKAILARQSQGHTSNFHFLDNLSRAIEHGGRILIDLIPTVYTKDRMIRVLGHDGKASNVQLGGPIPVKGPNGTLQQPQIDPTVELPISAICDLGRGKYDLTVDTGPSYATRREEITDKLTQVCQAFPEAAPILGDIIVKNMDIPDAEEVSRRLHALLPPQVLAAEGGQQQDPMQHPAVQALVQQGQQVIQQQGQALQQTQQQLAAAEQALAQAKQANDIKARELEIKAFEAQTDRLRAVGEATRAPEIGTTAQ